MKRVLIAAAALSLTGSAYAADLGARTYTKAPMMAAPVNTWQGLYIGGNVGYGWGNGNTDFGPAPATTLNGLAPTTLDAKPQGVIGGAQVGYNWQMGAIVTGLEADIQGSDIKGSAARSSFLTIFNVPQPPEHFITSTERLSWFGTVRGRLGVTVTPDFLLYATGGLAYGQVEDSANTHFELQANFPASISKTKVGWTAGAGGEWMFLRGWSAKLEYLYLDLGNESAIGAQIPASPLHAASYIWHTQDHIVRAGVNYHF